MLRMGKCVAKSHEIWAPSSLSLPTDPHDAALLFDVRILKTISLGSIQGIRLAFALWW